MSPKMIPGLAVNEGLDFVKKVWGSLPIPSVITPTTDIEELDKRISDLRAVEQWLNVNLSMLRATIQGLEVQRGTIATLKSFGSNLGVTKPAAKSEEKSGSGFSDALGNLGAGLVGAVGAIASGQSNIAAGLAAAQSGAGMPGAAAFQNPSSPGVSGAAAQMANAAAHTAPASAEQTATQSPTDEAVANALLANASNWWGVLQDQFNRVAGAAMSGAGLAAAAGDQAAAVAKPKAKRSVSASKATKPARSSSAIVNKTSTKAAPAKAGKTASRSRKP